MGYKLLSSIKLSETKVVCAFVGFVLLLFVLFKPYYHGFELSQKDHMLVYLNFTFALANLAILIFFVAKFILKYYQTIVRRHWLPLAVIVTIAIISITDFINFPISASFHSDPTYYEYAAQAAYLNKFNINKVFEGYYGPHGFVYGLFILASNMFIKDYFVSTKLTAIFFYIICLFSIYFLAYLILRNRLFSLFSALAFAYNYYTYIMSVNGSLEIVNAAFTVLFFLFFFLYDTYDIREARICFLLVFPLIVQMRISNAVLALPILIYLLAKTKVIKFINENIKLLIIIFLLVLPFSFFSAFSYRSHYKSMDVYNSEGIAVSAGMPWWDGIFSVKYFKAVFPNLMHSLFFGNILVGITSCVSLFMVIFILLPRDINKKILLLLWFSLPTIIFSFNFMNFPAQNLIDRYYLHVMIPFILLVNLLMYQISQYLNTIISYATRKIGNKKTRQRILTLSNTLMYLAVISLLAFTIYDFATTLRPIYVKQVTSSGDPDFLVFQDIAEKVHKGCTIVGDMHNGRDYVAYLNGYSFVDSYSYQLVKKSNCTEYFCGNITNWKISDVTCDSRPVDQNYLRLYHPEISIQDT